MQYTLQKKANLLFALVRMHFKLNDYRFFLGFLWSLIGPLTTAAVLYVIFKNNFGLRIPFFGLKLFIDVFSLNFFTSAVQITMNGMLQIRETALNNRVPLEVLLFAPLSVPFLKFGIELLICTVISFFSQTIHFSSLVFAPCFMVFLLIFSFGAGLCIGMLNGFAADTGEIWNRITPLFYFVTPLFYGLDDISTVRRIISLANPLTPFVLGLQQSLTGSGSFAFSALIFQSLSYTLLAVLAGTVLFKRSYRVILEK